MSKNGWRDVVLGDVVNFISKKIKVSELTVDNFISTENMEPDLGGINVSSGLPSATTTRIYLKKDVLFSNIRTYFKKVWFADRDGGCSNDVLVFRSSEKMIPKFLYYILSDQRFIDYTVTTAKGTKMPRGDRDAIEQYKFKLPPLPTQKAIAKILGDLDAKIELNRKMNENLEAMAQALFQSWFVDFDPVLDNFLAKNVNNVEALPEPLRKKGAIRLEVSKKNTPEINALFPSNFVFNEVLDKWIPEGWDVKAAGNVCNISIGKTPPRKQQEWFEKEPNCENKTWVSIKNMGSCGVYIDNSDECLTNESINKFNVKIVPKGTVILSFKMTVGRVAITSKELCTNEAIAHFISPKFNVSEMYLYNYLREFNYDILGSTSSIVTAVNSKIIKGMPILLPTKEILQHFDISIKSIFDQIYSISNQTQNLTKLRDTLLPQLISGKLEVPDAMLEIV